MKILKIGDVLKSKYGKKVYKISLSAGCTCPNRDGTKGVNGCIFCSQSGSGDFSQSAKISIAEQIKLAKEKISQKGAEKFIAYFQPFSNTYAPVSYLEPLFRSAINDADIVEIYIATRCDCLSDDIILMLQRINKIKPVTIEMGLQSIHAETLKKINCGYTLDDYNNALNKLYTVGLSSITHIILGFPWETTEQMIKTAEFLGNSKSNGIKIHMLHILKNTPLGEEYIKNPFDLFTLDEYTKVLGQCLKVLPNDMIIHRLTGDGAKRDLIAPLWSADKKRVLNTINKYISELK